MSCVILVMKDMASFRYVVVLNSNYTSSGLILHPFFFYSPISIVILQLSNMYSTPTIDLKSNVSYNSISYNLVIYYDDY